LTVETIRLQGWPGRLFNGSAGIQPVDGSTRPGVSPEALADPHSPRRGPGSRARPRSATHELELTPPAENWRP
jgi:hypothetical protein